MELLDLMVNNTARPPGRTDGNSWFSSPRAASGFVSAFGSPPAAATTRSPGSPPVANTIVLSGPQLAPRGRPDIAHSETGGPPAIGTFLSSDAVKNPTHRPSGETNGL